MAGYTSKSPDNRFAATNTDPTVLFFHLIVTDMCRAKVTSSQDTEDLKKTLDSDWCLHTKKSPAKCKVLEHGREQIQG